MKGLSLLVAFWLRRYEKLLHCAYEFALFSIKLKFFLGRGVAEGAILAKRPFTLLRLATVSRSAAQIPPRSLRVRSGETLFLKKHCSVKFNKFYFKFYRKIPKQVLVVKFYRTIRHKILKFSASRVLTRKFY